MKKFKIIMPVLLLTIFNTTVLADEIFRPYFPGRADFNFTVDYFKTTANFISDGSKTDMLSGMYFQNIDTTFGARYVLLENLGFSTALKVGNSESTDAVATRRNSSLSKILLGSDYQVFNTGFWNLTADLSYSQAIEKVDPATDSALNNDGANEIQGGLRTSLDFDRFAPFGQIGINYRTEGLSTLLLYSGGLEFRFESIKLGGLVTGYSTLKEDENTAKPFIRDLVTGRVDAGSKKYYSVNPTLLDSELYLQYNFDRNLSFKTFGGYTLIGTNTAVGFHMGAAVTWGFGGEESNPQRSSLTKGNQNKKSNLKNTLSMDPSDKQFSEDTNDGVNQDYFKPVIPTQDHYIEQLKGSPKSLQNATEIEPQEAPFNANTFEKDYKIKLKKKKKKK